MKPKYTEEEAAKMVADAVEAERKGQLTLRFIDKALIELLANPPRVAFDRQAWTEGVKAARSAIVARIK